jgi:hypothetical protein
MLGTCWNSTSHIVNSSNSYDYKLTTVVANVPSDYVVVGGSAIAFYTNYGALLTESRPTTELNGWIASAKEHIIGEYFTLWSVATGLRIDGITSEQLRIYITIATAYGSGSHPSAFATLPSGYAMVGGGASIYSQGNSAIPVFSSGNMLVSSYPYNSTSWYAEGKDHKVSDTGTITSYVIGIQNPIPNFGLVNSNISTPGPLSVGSGAAVLSGVMNNSTGGVFTCLGARTTYNGYGRILNAIVVGPEVFIDPNFTKSGLRSESLSFYAKSKDHLVTDSGDLTGYCVVLSKQ